MLCCMHVLLANNVGERHKVEGLERRKRKRNNTGRQQW